MLWVQLLLLLLLWFLYQLSSVCYTTTNTCHHKAQAQKVFEKNLQGESTNVLEGSINTLKIDL